MTTVYKYINVSTSNIVVTPGTTLLPTMQYTALNSPNAVLDSYVDFGIEKYIDGVPVLEPNEPKWSDYAGSSLVLPNGKAVNLMASVPGLSIVSSDADANTTALQTALNATGQIFITGPGTYYINEVLTVPSNTSVYIGAGVNLIPADGSPSAVFTNTAARSAGVPVSAANATYASTPANGYANNSAINVANMSAADAALFPVGSWVSVVVLGHGALGVKGTAWNNRGYRGVYKVVEQIINGATSSIKYLIDNVYPGGSASSNNLTLYPADENIKVWGPGTIDGNGALSDTAYNTGDPRGCVMWWRHAVNLTIEGLNFRRGRTWTIGSNYVRNYTVKALTCELRDPANFAAIDFVHLSGNHQNVLIEDSDGASADNFVGMTIDCTDAAAAGPFFPAYDFPYQHPGDMYDVTIRRARGEAISEDGAFGIIGLYGPEAYRYVNIKIDQISGMGSAAIQISSYDKTNQFKQVIDRLSVSNVRAFCSSAQIEFTASAIVDIGELNLDSLLSPREDVAVYKPITTASGTIRSLTMRNVVGIPYNGTTFTRTAALAQFGDININALNIMNSENIVMGANVHVFHANGAANIPKVGIQNCSATGSGTSAGLAALWSDTGGGTVEAPVYTNCTSNGTPL